MFCPLFICLSIARLAYQNISLVHLKGALFFQDAPQFLSGPVKPYLHVLNPYVENLCDLSMIELHDVKKDENRPLGFREKVHIVLHTFSHLALLDFSLDQAPLTGLTLLL